MRIFGGKNQGFTLAELVVVIAVIGILVAIVAAAYPGYQEMTHNNQRKSDLSQMAAAFKAYAIKKNDYMEVGSGCGYLGDGNGWFNGGPTATFPKSMMTCLDEAGVVDETFIDPSGCVWESSECGTEGGDPVTAYMKATCMKDGENVTYVFAHLEGEPRKDAEVDALCDGGTVAGFSAARQKWGSLYGMNYYVKVD